MLLRTLRFLVLVTTLATLALREEGQGVITAIPKGRFLVGLDVYDPTGRFVRSIGRVAIYDADADMTPRIEVLTLSLKRQ